LKRKAKWKKETKLRHDAQGFAGTMQLELEAFATKTIDNAA